MSPVESKGIRELSVRRLDTLDRNGGVTRRLHVFCPRRTVSADLATCSRCGFARVVSSRRVTCEAAAAPQWSSDDGLFVGRDPLAFRTAVGAICAPRALAIHSDALSVFGDLLSHAPSAAVVLADAGGVRGVLVADGTEGAPVALHLRTLAESAPLSKAIELMVHGHVRLVALVTEEDRFVGVVSDLDVLRWAAAARRASPKPLDPAAPSATSRAL